MRKLTDKDFDKASELMKRAGYGLDTCPTCDGKREMGEWDKSTYKFQKQDHECDCQGQWTMYLHYALAGIPEEYMRLDWYRDYKGDPQVTENLETYLGGWTTARKIGLGLELGGKSLGVGKTFAATHVAKELLKAGETVSFIRFNQLRTAVLNKDAPILDAVQNNKVLVLDEVQLPFTDNPVTLASFGNHFEELIRERSSWNRVTIMTTNLDEEQIEESFPRVYSLLSAKQMRIEMLGGDARQTHIAQSNLELMFNKEVRPIT